MLLSQKGIWQFLKRLSSGVPSSKRLLKKPGNKSEIYESQKKKVYGVEEWTKKYGTMTYENMEVEEEISQVSSPPPASHSPPQTPVPPPMPTRLTCCSSFLQVTGIVVLAFVFAVVVYYALQYYVVWQEQKVPAN